MRDTIYSFPSRFLCLEQSPHSLCPWRHARKEAASRPSRTPTWQHAHLTSLNVFPWQHAIRDTALRPSRTAVFTSHANTTGGRQTITSHQGAHQPVHPHLSQADPQRCFSSHFGRPIFSWAPSTVSGRWLPGFGSHNQQVAHPEQTAQSSSAIGATANYFMVDYAQWHFCAPTHHYILPHTPQPNVPNWACSPSPGR